LKKKNIAESLALLSLFLLIGPQFVQASSQTIHVAKQFHIPTPDGILIYNRSDGDIYFPTYDQSGNNLVSILNPAANKIIANVSVPLTPWGTGLYVPNSAEVWIGASSQNSPNPRNYFEIIKGTRLVSVVSTTFSASSSYTTSIYNPSNGYVYTLGGDIYNGLNNSLVGSVNYVPKCNGKVIEQGLDSLVYVPYSKMVYISGDVFPNSCNIHDFIIQLEGTKIVGILSLPSEKDYNDFLLYDPANNGLYVGGAMTTVGAAYLRVVNTETGKVVKTFSITCSHSCDVTPVIYSAYNNNIYIRIDQAGKDDTLKGILGMVNSKTNALVLKIDSFDETFSIDSFGLPTPMVYDSSNACIYIASTGYNIILTLSVVSTVANQPIVHPFHLDNNEAVGSVVYDPNNALVYLADSYGKMFVVSSN
jgi:hypothetical protein